MARADQGMGAGATGQQGGKHAGATEGLTETDLAATIQGDNSLQADDQHNVQNERKAQAEALKEGGASGDIVENAKRAADPDYRAQKELGKGNRYSEDHPHNSDTSDGDGGIGGTDPDNATHNDPADVNHDAWAARDDNAA